MNLTLELAGKFVFFCLQLDTIGIYFNQRQTALVNNFPPDPCSSLRLAPPLSHLFTSSQLQRDELCCESRVTNTARCQCAVSETLLSQLWSGREGVDMTTAGASSVTHTITGWMMFSDNHMVSWKALHAPTFSIPLYHSFALPAQLLQTVKSSNLCKHIFSWSTRLEHRCTWRTFTSSHASNCCSEYSAMFLTEQARTATKSAMTSPLSSSLRHWDFILGSSLFTLTPNPVRVV